MGTDVQQRAARMPPRTGGKPDIGAAAVTHARHAMHELLDELGLAGTDAAAVAELLGSELLTNALTHTGGFSEWDLSYHAGRIRVSVTDGRPDLPPKIIKCDDPLEALLSECGRGIPLFNSLASEWGWIPLPWDRCKKVFVYVDTRGDIDG